MTWSTCDLFSLRYLNSFWTEKIQIPSSFHKNSYYWSSTWCSYRFSSRKFEIQNEFHRIQTAFVLLGHSVVSRIGFAIFNFEFLTPNWKEEDKIKHDFRIQRSKLVRVKKRDKSARKLDFSRFQNKRSLSFKSMRSLKLTTVEAGYIAVKLTLRQRSTIWPGT